MATFPYLPDWGASPDLTPRLRSVQFGDGYQQRAEDGLNTIMPSWRLTFSSRTQLEAQAIGAWMITNKAHVNAFDWAAPGEGTVSNETILTGDGTRNTAQLSHLGRAVQYTGTPTIYRTDGSGTRALTISTEYTLSANGLVTLAPTTNPVAGQNLGTANGSTAAITITTPNGTNPTVTGVWRTDWQGRQRMYSTARTNNAIRSQEFGSWTLGSTTVGSDVIAAPDGTTTADSIIETAISSQHYCNLGYALSNNTYTASVYMKAGERTLGFFQMGSVYVPVDLVSGTLGAVTGGGTATITNYGNGWWRVTLTATTSGQSLLAGPITGTLGSPVYSYLGVANNRIYAWGAQLELGSVATSYIPTSASAVTVTDYSVASFTVTFATNPLAGAVIEADYTYVGGLGVGNTLSWSGTYTRKYIAKWTPARPDAFNSWTVTAEFSEVPA